MFAVIFRAKIAKLDNAYTEFAARLRELAINQYGCRDFISMSSNNDELSISYWDTLQQITDWKQDAEHLLAQQYAKSKWYKSYHVEIVQLIRSYRHGG